jgi:hypothetical protein
VVVAMVEKDYCLKLITPQRCWKIRKIYVWQNQLQNKK